MLPQSIVAQHVLSALQFFLTLKKVLRCKKFSHWIQNTNWIKTWSVYKYLIDLEKGGIFSFRTTANKYVNLRSEFWFTKSNFEKVIVTVLRTFKIIIDFSHFSCHFQFYSYSAFAEELNVIWALSSILVHDRNGCFGKRFGRNKNFTETPKLFLFGRNSKMYP